MKVYVVTAGEYSDYQIVGVATTKEMADVIVAKHNLYDGYDEARIEEYDTDVYEPLRTNDQWSAWKNFNEQTNQWEIECERNNYVSEEVNNVIVNYDGHGKPYSYYVVVYAVNEESAIKIASEKFAEYQAMEEGLV